MLRSMLKSKIHRATVTEANLHYEGSLTVDRLLLDAADMRPFEQVMIYNIANGERFDTYLIEGEAGSGTVCLNGAAARRGMRGDLVIVASYCLCTPEDVERGHSILVWVDAQNRVTKTHRAPW